MKRLSPSINYRPSRQHKPEMNWRELADRLRLLWPDLKVLFMSGYTADIITRQGVLTEGVNFIQKPFTSKNLAHKMQEVLDKVL